MNTNTIHLDDFDSESQSLFQGMNFLDWNRIDFEGRQNGFNNIKGKYQGQTIRGMTNVTPLVTMKFKGLNSDDIFNRYFPVAEPKYNYEVIAINDVDCNIDLNDFTLTSKKFYVEQNNNQVKDKNELDFTMIIYKSKNGNKIREAYECVKPNANEVLLFIEDNKNDWSKQVLFAKMADNLRDEVKSNLWNDVDLFNYVSKNASVESTEILAELIEKGYVEEKITVATVASNAVYYFFKIIFSPTECIAWLLNKIGNGIDFLQISEKIWDTQNNEYLLKKENLKEALKIDDSLLISLQNELIITQKGFQLTDVLPDFFEKIILKVINFVKNTIAQYNEFISLSIDQTDASLLKEQIAFYSGLWNGLIDFISGIFKFVTMLLEAPSTIVANFQPILETLDTFFDTGVDFNFTQFISDTYSKFKNYFKENDSNDYDWVRIAYSTGFGIIFIATFFIPFAQLTKLANLEKTGAKISQLLSKFLEEASAGTQKVTTFVSSKTQQAYNASLELLTKFIDLLGNAKKLKAFIDEILEKLAQWFLKNKKAVALVEEIDSYMLHWIKVLKQNPKYLDSIEYIKEIKRPLGRYLVLEQESALNLYTKSYYILFNKALRKLEGVTFTREFKAMQNLLDNALSKLPNFDQKGNYLLRSTYFKETEIKKLFQVGKDFTDKGFFSTTHSEEALLRWMKREPTDNVLIKVVGKNGKLIELSSNSAHEAEVLFKSNTTFVVENVRKVEHPIFSRAKRGDEVTEIILKEK